MCRYLQRNWLSKKKTVSFISFNSQSLCSSCPVKGCVEECAVGRLYSLDVSMFYHVSYFFYWDMRTIIIKSWPLLPGVTSADFSPFGNLPSGSQKCSQSFFMSVRNFSIISGKEIGQKTSEGCILFFTVSASVRLCTL